ncbi:MAG: TPR end-of-group domain-containing protein [Gemmataceae bacterium]
MPQPAKRTVEQSQTLTSALLQVIEKTQLDFELDFFSGILGRCGTFVDVLRAHGNNLTIKGRVNEGLEVDQKLIQLGPDDALAHYNLACSLALLNRPDSAFKTLRKAVELGYRDFRYMRDDKDLESIRTDPRFKQLIQEFDGK